MCVMKEGNEKGWWQGDQQPGHGEDAGGGQHVHGLILEEGVMHWDAAEKAQRVHDPCNKMLQNQSALHPSNDRCRAFDEGVGIAKPRRWFAPHALEVVPLPVPDYERRNKDRFAGKHKSPA